MNVTRRMWMSLTLAAALAVPAGAAAQGWSYQGAAKPYAGRSITVLDEVTPLQEHMKTLVPEFEKVTGIKVTYELLNHFEVISKGQADMLSGRGAYDAVMLHSPQMGLLLDAGVIRPIDDLLGNKALTNPGLERGDFIQPAADSLTKFKGKTYGFLNWNYNVIYWARGDLFGHPDERAAFKKKYGYDLAPAKTLQQMRDIAEFFTRKKGDKLAGQTLESDFYGVVMEGIKGGTTLWTVLNAFVKNFGGDIFDAEGKPTVNRPENVAGVKFWADLWKFSPPGQAEYSLIDVPTVMGNGIAAQTLAWSDFVLGIDQPGKPTVNRPENVAGVKFWADLWKFSPPGQAEYSLIDVPTVMGNGIAAQTLAWSDFVLGIDQPGKSKLAGKFVYAGSPANAQGKKRSAETEPSGLVISKHSKQAEATYLFMQWLVDKGTQQMLFDKSGGAGVPVRNSTWALPSVKQSKYTALYAAMQESLKYGTAKPKAPKLFEVMDVLVGLVQEVGLGKKTAEQALKEGQERVLAICSKCTL